jgi:hypothetical protein
MERQDAPQAGARHMTDGAPIGAPFAAFEIQNPGNKPRKRYRYHDRGDGTYMAERENEGHPHLVLTGECVPGSHHVGLSMENKHYAIWRENK